MQSLSTVSSLGFHRLAPASRDLEQARLAIEALRALAPVLRDALPPESARDFESVTANLQLAYARAVEEERRSPPEQPETAEPAADEPAEGG